MAAPRTDPGLVAGAPEAALSDRERAGLPATTPEPPWRCRVQAVVWVHRAPPAALEALPPVLRRRVHAPMVVGAVVRYLDSPVGPYEELLGGVLVRPLLLHLPFLAVDSLASVHGGRVHWALPKAVAAFSRPGPARVVVEGDRWRVAVDAAPRGPRLPVVGRLPGMQVGPGGERVGSTSTARGSGRGARVTVQVGTDRAGEPGSIAGWLRSGRHPGAALQLALTVGRPGGGGPGGGGPGGAGPGGGGPG